MTTFNRLPDFHHGTATRPSTGLPPLCRAAVVVGVDGSPDSLAAVRLATTEACVTGASLAVVQVVAPASTRGLDAASLRAWLAQRRVALASLATGSVEAFGLVLVGEVGHQLAEQSRWADLVVVGRGGDVLAGRTADAVVRTSHAPVLVTRGTSRPTTPSVVLGLCDDLDGRFPSTAVGHAFERASRAAVDLHVVGDWQAYAWPGDPVKWATHVRHRLAPWTTRWPSVRLTVTVPVQAHARALRDTAGRGATLVLPRSRGSLSHCLREAIDLGSGDVLVVPEPDERPGRTTRAEVTMAPALGRPTARV